MLKHKKLFYGLLLFLLVLLTPLLVKNTVSLLALGGTDLLSPQPEAPVDIPPYTQVIPVTGASSPNPTQAAMQLNTFEFVTVTPTPPLATIGPTTGGVSGSCGSVTEWGQKINDSLVVGQKGYDKLTTPLSNCGHSAADSTKSFVHYWCTYLIVDAYNLAGFKGLSIGSHAAVVSMRNWWKSASGYRYLDGNTRASASAAAPGYAVFLELEPGKFTGKEHVFIIKTITMDGNGNGSVTTLEANAAAKSRTFPIVAGQIKNTSYPVRGYGGR